MYDSDQWSVKAGSEWGVTRSLQENSLGGRDQVVSLHSYFQKIHYVDKVKINVCTHTSNFNFKFPAVVKSGCGQNARIPYRVAFRKWRLEGAKKIGGGGVFCVTSWPTNRGLVECGPPPPIPLPPEMVA